MQQLGIETGLLPSAGIADKQEAVMQPIWTVEPEFDVLWMQAESAPVGRAGDFAGMGFGEGVGFGFERSAAGKNPALVGNGCTDLAPPRTAVEVNVGGFLWKLGNGAFDADLAAQGFPVEAECGARIFGELAALLTFSVGEKAEAFFSDALGENHAHTRCAVCGCGGESAGVGIVWLATLGFAKPEVELDKRILGERIVGGYLMRSGHRLILGLVGHDFRCGPVLAGVGR
jgi:hypothetical protein